MAKDIRLKESQSKERDGIAKWSSISTLFMTRSYEFPGTGSELQVWRILDLTCVPHMLIGIEHVFVYYDCWLFTVAVYWGFLFLSMKGERPIRSFVRKSLALLEIMWSILFWLWAHECLLVLCRTAYGLGCWLGVSRLHTWKQAIWLVSSNQTQRVVEFDGNSSKK